MTARGSWNKVPEERFQGTEFGELPWPAQAIRQWLIAGPRNCHALYNLPAGLTRVTPSMIAAIMEKPVEEVEAALPRLQDWVMADWRSGWIYVPEATQWVSNAKEFKGFLKRAREHLDNNPVVRAYLADVIGTTAQRAKGWKKDIANLPGPEMIDDFLAFFNGDIVEENMAQIPFPIPYGKQHRTENIEVPHVERTPSPSELQTDGPLKLLQALHPQGDLFSICAFGPNDRAEVQHFGEATEALEAALRLDTYPGFHGVFWGLANLREDLTGRGKAADVLSINGAWVDIDAKDELGNRDSDLALIRIDILVANKQIPTPSAIVDSGGGVHAYWLLDEPATGADLALIPLINQALAERVGGDHVSDLARLLRVPGTRNRKPDYPTQPLCEIHDLQLECRYRLPWLMDFLSINANKTGARTPPPITGSHFQETLPSQWPQFVSVRPEVRDLWSTPLPEGERSEAAQSLANYAAHGGITDPDEIATILHHAPALGTWAKDKPTALGHTIAKAIEGIE
jgi:hypothetical protein